MYTLATRAFPFTFKTGLQFSLFRSYGIPTISKLLLQTSQFSSPDTACKRYADTGALIDAFFIQKWGSEYWVQAVARVNAIHAVYQSTGKISDTDMLYTLALFATQPLRWIGRWEWRELAEVERVALGVFCKGIGDAMGISWAGLPVWDEGQRGWAHGGVWLDEISTWADRYEEQHMVPARSNHETAEQTTRILLWVVPRQLRSVGMQAVCAMMDERLRKAMIYPAASHSVTAVLHTVLKARKLFLRHLALPRPHFFRTLHVTEAADKDGRFFMLDYDAQPWYVRPTVWSRWHPGAWVFWAMGLSLPGDRGDMFCPTGFRTREVGVGKGVQAEVQRELEDRVRKIGERTWPEGVGDGKKQEYLSIP